MNWTKHIYQKCKALTGNWTQIACLAVRHFNYFTRMFSVLVGGCLWILFTLRWFCPIYLIHLIGRKCLNFKKKTRLENHKLFKDSHEKSSTNTSWLWIHYSNAQHCGNSGIHRWSTKTSHYLSKIESRTLTKLFTFHIGNSWRIQKEFVAVIPISVCALWLELLNI